MGLKGTIPLIPNSMTISLQEDILQFMVEMKFILLFIDKPMTILSTSNFDYLSEEIIGEIKKGKKPATNLNNDINNFQFLSAVATDEFDELLSYCEPIHYEMNSTEVPKDAEYYDNYYSEVDNIFQVLGIQFSGHVGILFTRFEDIIKKFPEKESFFITLSRLYVDMYRILEVLKTCKKSNSSMIWSSENERTLCGMYSKYLILSNKKDDSLKKKSPTIRRLIGADLLREIFDLEIVNISTVPSKNIIDFRKDNKDLLDNFLMNYREFLLEIQHDPTESKKILSKHSTLLVDEFKKINSEILLHRRNNQFGWLKNISEPVFEGAKKGTLISILSSFENPAALLGLLGSNLLKERTNKVTEDNILFSNDVAGYLWKAHDKWNK